MKNNKKGFSLVLAMGIVILISLIAYNILEYIIPFGKEVKGVENSSRSYYLANSGIEEGLYHISTRTDEKAESSRLYVGDISHEYNTFSSGTILPPAGEGNSNYDHDNGSIIEKNRNTISQGNPIQLSVGNGYVGDLTDFNIAFRTPDLDFYDPLHDNTETLSGDTLAIINWQLTSLNNTLNASGGIILANQILDSSEKYSDGSIDLNNLQGADLNGNDGISIETFYGNNCNGTNSGCTLKFSIVNKLELNTGNVPVPYLEWQMQIDTDLDGDNNIPLRYTKIDSGGKSIGYKKELDIKVPTKTVNQAFDFTVFQ